MPYDVKKSGDKWQCYNPDTGKVYGTFESRHEAMAQQALLYRNAPPNKESKKKKG